MSFCQSRVTISIFSDQEDFLRPSYIRDPAPHKATLERLSIVLAGCAHLLQATSKLCIQGVFTLHPNPHIGTLGGAVQLSQSEFSLLLSVACTVSLEDSVSYLDNGHHYYHVSPALQWSHFFMKVV